MSENAVRVFSFSLDTTDEVIKNAWDSLMAKLRMKPLEMVSYDNYNNKIIQINSRMYIFGLNTFQIAIEGTEEDRLEHLAMTAAVETVHSEIPRDLRNFTQEKNYRPRDVEAVINCCPCPFKLPAYEKFNEVK